MVKCSGMEPFITLKVQALSQMSLLVSFMAIHFWGKSFILREGEGKYSLVIPLKYLFVMYVTAPFPCQ